MESLTTDEQNLIFRQLCDYERLLKHHIKTSVDEGSLSYEEYQDDTAELEIVGNILAKLKGGKNA